jgi:N-acetylglucosamine kinase-like BadF-type ATPase
MISDQPHLRSCWTHNVVSLSMTKTVFLGIDGGASKTACAVLDESGCLLAAVQQGPSAIIGTPSKESCETLRAVAREALRQAGCSHDQVAHCGVGLNGIDLPADFPVQHHRISEALGFDPPRVRLANDGIAALWGATERSSAAIVQFGSGITAAYRSRYGNERLFDHLDTGRLFDLRRELISVVARMIDGRMAPTPLMKAALNFFSVAAEDFHEAAFCGRITSRQKISTAPLIFKHWLEGDVVATQLVERTIDDLAASALAMIAFVDGQDFSLVYAGGVINNAPGEFYDRLVKRTPRATICRPLFSPAIGACLMAAFAAGTDVSGLYSKLKLKGDK